MKELFDITLIGGGLASLGTMRGLLMRDASLRILCISAPNVLTPCSVMSTALVSLWGVKKGISPLGDLLSESFSFFEEMLETDPDLEGVFKADFYSLALNESSEERMLKRYGDLKELELSFDIVKGVKRGVREKGHCIGPSLFLNSLVEGVKRKGDVRFEQGLVTGLCEKSDHVKVVTLEGREYLSSVLVDARGSHRFPLTQESLQKSKKVPGQFLSWKNIDFGRESFVFSFDGMNLIYRSWNGELLLGGTSSAEGFEVRNKKELKEALSLIKGEGFFMPPLKDAKVHSGIREKAPKRTPFARRLKGSERVFEIGGLYKNGYTTGPYLGDQLSSSILDSLRRV